MKILKQTWYREEGRIWHSEPKFNLIGNHVTFVSIEDKEIEEVFTVRNHNVTVTLKFKDESFFSYEVMKNSLYLDVKWEIVGKGIIKSSVHLSWYTLTYYWHLNGKEVNKIEANKLSNQEKNNLGTIFENGLQPIDVLGMRR